MAERAYPYASGAMTALPLDGSSLAKAPLDGLRALLSLPSDAALFYAFGGAADRAESAPARAIEARVLWELRAGEWWSDYRRRPPDRAADPIRRAVRRSVVPVRWRDYEDRPGMSPVEIAMWRRAREMGVRDGLSAPLHDPAARRYGALSVMHFGRLAEFDDWVRSCGALLAPAAYLAHLAISGTTVASAASSLSRRERQCLALVAEGLGGKAIAHRLGLSPRTVELHVARAMRRLGAANRSHAVALALRSGAIQS